MESLVRRYIVTKGQVKPLLDACIIFPRENEALYCTAHMITSG